jgi:hypothetical protein
MVSATSGYIGEDVVQGEPDSEPLIDRYYGLMPGFFLHLARLELPAEIYTSHRTRIN